jgi:hypothetical protein
LGAPHHGSGLFYFRDNMVRAAMTGDQAKIVRKFSAGLTANEKRQLREICGAAIRDTQGKLKVEASLARCAGVDGPMRGLQSEIRMLIKMVKLLTVMAA